MLGFIQTLINAIIGKTDEAEYGDEVALEKKQEMEKVEGFFETSFDHPSIPNELEPIIKKYEQQYALPEYLLAAVAFRESSFRVRATRYEPAFQKRYIDDNPKYEDLPEEERRWLSTSAGLTQPMGVVAIELGFSFADPDDIYDPATNLEIGAYYLRKLINKYDSVLDAVSSYNQGNPRKDKNGLYKNQDYVDKVISTFKKYRRDAGLENV